MMNFIEKYRMKRDFKLAEEIKRLEENFKDLNYESYLLNNEKVLINLMNSCSALNEFSKQGDKEMMIWMAEECSRNPIFNDAYSESLSIAKEYYARESSNKCASDFYDKALNGQGDELVENCIKAINSIKQLSK